MDWIEQLAKRAGVLTTEGRRRATSREAVVKLASALANAFSNLQTGTPPAVAANRSLEPITTRPAPAMNLQQILPPGGPHLQQILPRPAMNLQRILPAPPATMP